jgi:RNA polymerase sigma-70 factor (ECF subfamily)
LEDEVDQDDWYRQLVNGGADRERAIEALRAYLLRGLSRSLVHRYGGKVQVEDVVQIALLRILKSLETFEHRSQFGTWAMAIAIRVGISELRRNYYRDVSLDQFLTSESIATQIVDRPDSSFEDNAERDRLLRLLQKLIDETLSDKQRQAIRSSLSGLPVEEIAARLDSNRNAIYKLLHDARVRLRQGLEANGVMAEDIFTLFE